MNVGELKTQLEQYPDDVMVNIMFEQGDEAFHPVGTELLELRGDQKVVVIDIGYQPKLGVA